ncbi:FAD-binding oxidoreductase [Phaeovibrio sulfidiphilus]|uniref:FAD-binding oxidoreductase n=1 Tax=Phaeovibrio sulfidiphilus TaxID=1220600 RepID=A0A8J6YZY2_9PROT|nr:FAD-binding oxidoreductase [Phaeovibrio sulfidiphilus]MBE1237538.1 FAD-binding oxidoreductase [Phaeovibrio sulfidiphilus]
MAIHSALIEALGACLGPRGLLTDPKALIPYNEEQRRNYHGEARVVARPATTAECAAVVRLCREAGVSVVPQGGNTGLVGGAVATGDQVLLSLDRMGAVRWIDPEGYRIAVDGGCILADVQRHADEAGRLFPLSLGAEGSCRIGGNLATNAGGLNVLRYGPARSLCLGLEVVLPDGRIWDGLRVLEKDNTGYALKHLFIGSEGSLGIITGAVLKLFPRQTSTVTALCGLTDVRAVVPLLSRARAITGDEVSAFELMSRFAYGLGVRHLDGVRDVLDTPFPWYVLVELSTSRARANLDETLAILLEDAFDSGLIADAAVACSEAQRQMLWTLREGLPEAQKKEGASIKHDIGVPVSRIPAFLERALPEVERLVPGIRPCPFGHVGDGNLHFNLTRPEAMGDRAFLDRREELNARIHDIVMDMNGTFSAEHGVGRLKTRELAQYRSPEEMDLMRTLKRALDPANLMNPGVIV